MLPTLRDGTPLCQLKQFAKEPLAWPKLWKHHGGKSADGSHQSGGERAENFLKIMAASLVSNGFSQVLETLENAPSVYAAAEVWVEAGDWMVWQLTGASADELPQSTARLDTKRCGRKSRLPVQHS